MTPHIHRWNITTREDGITLYTCRTPGCKRQMRIEEFEPFDSVRPPEPRCYHPRDAEFSGEANDCRNIIGGAVIGASLIGFALLVMGTYLYYKTGQFWPQ